MNGASDSKFVTRNWNIVNDQSNANYSEGNEIIYSTEVLKSNLCDYNDAYILVRSGISVIGHIVAQVTFKNCSPSIRCITKIDGTTIDGAQDLYFVMATYNVLEYSSNYSKMTGSLRFYSKDEAANFNADITNNDAFKYFKYEDKLLGNTIADGGNRILKNIKIAALLEYLSNFLRSLEITLINCKVELKLK